jgi:ABC-type proline/glycine betaine transport system substrate-binding protein
MKRKLFFAGVLFFVAMAFNSCEILNDCKTCRQVTYVDNAWDHETNPSEYCGASLLAIEAQADIISGDSRTTWECN